MDRRIAGMENAYQVQVCRGLQGGCPFALWSDPSLVQGVEAVLRASPWPVRRIGQDGRGAIPHHLQLKVALAACPNACTLPQIRDIGVIATLTPARVRPECDACGNCERACREGAMAVPADWAELCVESCVGCGACIRACPQDAIETSGVQLRVLVGGRMGRHPRWAEPVGLTDPASLTRVLRTLLEVLAKDAPGEERVAGAVERIGIERLQRSICPAACAGVQERNP
jgi:anaerobic sulfite reductase subunit C